MADKPTILFVALIEPDYSPFLASTYGLQRKFDLLPHKYSILALTAWIRQHGCEGHYVWADAPDEEGFRVVDEAIERTRPHAIGLSALTEEIVPQYKVIEHIKGKYPHLPVIAGGLHVSSLPEHTLENFPLIDYVAIGEGERTLEEWLPRAARGAPQSEMRDIAGLAFRDESGRIVITAPREKFQDINILPEPAFDLISHPDTPPEERSAFPLVTSYGCHYHCTFCSVEHGFYRCLEPVRVVDRIERVQRELGIEYFAVRDSFWPPSREWLDHFCDEIEKRDLRIKFHFQTRAGSCTEEQLARLKRLGAQAVAMGVEAGDPAILKSIKKGITLNMARRTVASLNKVGIFSITFFIFGNKGENQRTLQASVDFARELNPSGAFFFALCPLPGAEAFESVREGEKDWWMSDLLPSICDIPSDELVRLGGEAFLRYPLRWAYLKQHVLYGRLSPEFRHVARCVYLIHLRKLFLGLIERSEPGRKAIYMLKRALGK